MNRTSFAMGASLVALCAATATQAQEAADSTATAQASSVGEIVVTAQKRSESLQKVPLAITAVTAETLAESGINDLQGVTARVPNLNLGQQLGVAKIALRGIGLENIAAGAEGSIAFHVDGVFISRSLAATASFYDVQQVEVLRGPQGTLYGRNATGGSINLTTRGPTQELSGYFNVTAGNYDRIAAEGALSGALVDDVVSARVAFRAERRDGYGENIVTGNDIDNLHNYAGRLTLLIEPSDRASLELKGDYYHQKDRAGGYHYLGGAGFDAAGTPITPVGLLLGGQVPTDVRDIANESDPRNRVEFWGVSGKFSYELSDDIEFRAITAYRELDYSTDTDLDSTSAALTPTNQQEHDKQFSTEIQLSGQHDRLTWLLGGFYFHENDQGGISIPFDNAIVGFPPDVSYLAQGYFSGGRIITDALAAFGQASYDLTDQLTFTLGARYSTEKKKDFDQILFDFATPYDPATRIPFSAPEQNVRFNSFTPRIALDYQATPDVLLYASWSKGFKAGTYNLGALQAPVRPEKIDAWEAGIKSTLGGNVRANLAGFYYDYKDLQVGKVIGNNLALENAATATIYGLEAELQAQLTPNFELTANAAWLHARFDEYFSADPSRPAGDGSTFVDAAGDYIPGATAATPGAFPAFDLAGNALSQSPDFTFFLGAQYTLPTDAGDFSLRGELAWRDDVYYTPFNRDEAGQKAFAKLNAFLNWESISGQWNGQLFVKNITNKTTVGNSYVSTGLVGFPVNGYLEEPRTFGLRVGYEF